MAGEIVVRGHALGMEPEPGFVVQLVLAEHSECSADQAYPWPWVVVVVVRTWSAEQALLGVLVVPGL